MVVVLPGDLQIAVIDDDKSFRLALVDGLYSFGYTADGYASAEDFITSIGARSFGCIVTDIHMPGMSGLDLIQSLVSADRKIPVVLITARSDAGLSVDATAAGAVCLLRKPFDISDLIECIERAVKA